MPRVALLAGSRIPVVTLPDDAVLLAPPPPVPPLADVEAAVREALRYPIAGPSLAEAAMGARRATIVVEPPLLPLPGAPFDPRRDALAATIDALAEAGVPPEGHTLLVAGGLEQRPGRRDLEELLRPARARSFRGRVVVHDCEADDLVRVGESEGVALRCHPALVETDIVLTVGASETVLHGGPSALVAACGAGTVRAARAESLLEARTAAGWRVGTALEAAILTRAPVVGVCLVLDLPRISGRHRGYPHDERAREAAARSPLRRLVGLAPAAVRHSALQSLGRELHAVAVLAGRPSAAQAEALVRGTSLRGIAIDRPFDTVVVPLPWKGVHRPRAPLDPIGAMSVGLGLALRLWRGAHPLVSGGTVVLLHPLRRGGHAAIPGPTRALLAALRDGPSAARIGEAEAVAARDRGALADYRAGRAAHPRLPFADWEACAPTLERAGRVIAAGCRDASAARAVGAVPSHSVAVALEMARGVAGDGARLGVLLAPPYAPVLVGM